MANLLKKELKLAISPLTYIFLVFTFMTFIPGYPILMGTFFVCMGIFQSFHQSRVTNDILYTALLPVEKGDAVRSKYIMVCFFEVLAFILILIFSLIRMTSLNNGMPYSDNFLMNANFLFLGFSLLIFLAFNVIFVNGFLKTIYKINKPYLLFVLVAIIIIGVGEMLHFLPGLDMLNENPGKGADGFLTEGTSTQIIIFAICLVLYVAGTIISYRLARKRFEKLDL